MVTAIQNNIINQPLNFDKKVKYSSKEKQITDSIFYEATLSKDDDNSSAKTYIITGGVLLGTALLFALTKGKFKKLDFLKKFHQNILSKSNSSDVIKNISDNSHDVIRMITPEKQALIDKSPMLKKYCQSIEDMYQHQLNWSNNTGLENIKKKFNILSEIDITEFSKMEKIIEKASRYKVVNKSILDTIGFHWLCNLGYYNPQTFEYLIQNHVRINSFALHIDPKCFDIKTLTTIRNGVLNDILRKYTNSSDNIYADPKLITELSDFLKTKKLTTSMTVFRGERHTGIFSAIPLEDKFLRFKIKLANWLNKKLTKNTPFIGYPQTYEPTSYTNKGNLYEMIKSKKQLSLADAMLMFKYLKPKEQEQILRLIKQSKIEHFRFLSTSLSEKQAITWAKDYFERTSPAIVQKITLPQGTQGCYINNDHFEILVNTTPKTFEFTNVRYDMADDIFYMDSNLRMQ